MKDIKAALTAGPIDALQSRYNIFQREVELEILPFCQTHQISFIPWGPLAFGLLGGKYSSAFKLPENDWHHRSGLFDNDSFRNNLAVVERLKKLAKKGGFRCRILPFAGCFPTLQSNRSSPAPSAPNRSSKTPGPTVGSFPLMKSAGSMG